MVVIRGELINLGMPLMNDSGVPSFCIRVDSVDGQSAVSSMASKLIANRVFGGFVSIEKRSGEMTKEQPALVAGIIRPAPARKRTPEDRPTPDGEQPPGSTREGRAAASTEGDLPAVRLAPSADTEEKGAADLKHALLVEVAPLKNTHFKVRRSLEPFVQQSVFVRDFSRALCRKKYIGKTVVIRLAHFLRNLFDTNGAGYMQTAAMLKYAITVDAMKFEMEIEKARGTSNRSLSSKTVEGTAGASADLPVEENFAAMSTQGSRTQGSEQREHLLQQQEKITE